MEAVGASRATVGVRARPHSGALRRQRVCGWQSPCPSDPARAPAGAAGTSPSTARRGACEWSADDERPAAAAAERECGQRMRAPPRPGRGEGAGLGVPCAARPGPRPHSAAAAAAGERREEGVTQGGWLRAEHKGSRPDSLSNRSFETEVPKAARGSERSVFLPRRPMTGPARALRRGCPCPPAPGFPFHYSIPSDSFAKGIAFTRHGQWLLQ